MFTADFKNSKLEPQTKDVEIPLAMCGDMFVKKIKEPVFKVRGLTGAEYYKVTEARRDMKKLTNVLEAVQGDEAKIKEVVKDLGGQAENPEEFLKDKELVRLGCIEPSFADTKMLKTFANNYPMVLHMLANEILTLSGMGGVSKKKR